MTSHDPAIVALGRAMYNASGSVGQQWAIDLPLIEKERWCERAARVAEELDRLGYELKFIPPEG